MEKNISSAPPSYYSQKNADTIMFSLMSTDSLVFFRFPESDLAQIRYTIGSSYPPGIQKETADSEKVSFTFKLRGNPWMGLEEESLRGRVLLLALLKCTSALGWGIFG